MAPDWTEVWVQGAPLSPAEVLLSLLLLSASLLLESLSRGRCNIDSEVIYRIQNTEISNRPHKS